LARQPLKSVGWVERSETHVAARQFGAFLTVSTGSSFNVTWSRYPLFPECQRIKPRYSLVMRTAIRVATSLYVLQAVVGAAVGFTLPFLNYLAR
jgi:hypothetical protein